MYQITLEGSDHFGDWKADGYVSILTDNTPFFWMHKKYNDPVRAGHTGRWSVLLYESTEFTELSCKGIWFFSGMRGDPVYSGIWKI